MKKNLFERRDLWGNSPAIWIVALMVFLIPFGWRSLIQLRLENDVERWLPADDPQLRVLEEARKLFPTEDWIFVSWEGSSLGDPRVAELVRRFEGVTDDLGIKREGLKEVSSVIEPRDLLDMIQRNHVEPQEAARRLHGVLVGSGPLKVRLTDAGRQRFRKTKTELSQAMQAAFGMQLELLEPMADVAAYTAIPVPTEEGEDAALPAPAAVLTPDGTMTTRESLDHDLQIVWNGMSPGSPQTTEIVAYLKDFRWRQDPNQPADVPVVEDCFFVLGSPVTLIVGLSEAGLADKSHTLETFRATAESSGIPREKLRLGGPAVAGNALNQKVQEAAWNTAVPLTDLPHRSVILLSAIVGAALSFLMVRSLRLSVLILAVSIYATYLSLAIVPATGGSLNMVLAVMPTLLLVITLSGAIHVANYWKHSAAENAATAIATTCRTAIYPCAMASLTTSIGLISLCTSSLSPVRDFGLYAALGTMISLLVVVFGLPALLELWPGRAPQKEDLNHVGWRTFAGWITRRPTLQATAFLLACLACSAGLKFFRTETKVIRYFADSSSIVQDYWFLEDQVAGIVPIQMLIRFDATAQDQTNFLERMEVVREIEEQLRRYPDISGCLSLADFQPVTEKLPEDAGILTASRFHKRANVMQQKIRDGEVAGASNFYVNIPEDSATSTSESLGLPGEEVWRVTSQVFVMPTNSEYGTIMADIDQIVRDILRYHPGTHHVVTGAVPLFLQTQQAVLNSLIESFGLAFVLVLGIFVVFMRNLWAGLVAMIPNIIPITVVFGLLGWCGQRVDIGVMITASIALGIAVDGTLHFLTWYRHATILGKSRQEAITLALVHCGPAMWQTSAAVAIGLLMLVPAELLLISRFGWLMAAMIGVALLADIMLLPQLLASPLGKLFDPPTRTNRRSEEVEDTVSVSASPPAPHVIPSERASQLRIQPR